MCLVKRSVVLLHCLCAKNTMAPWLNEISFRSVLAWSLAFCLLYCLHTHVVCTGLAFLLNRETGSGSFVCVAAGALLSQKAVMLLPTMDTRGKTITRGLLWALLPLLFAPWMRLNEIKWQWRPPANQLNESLNNSDEVVSSSGNSNCNNGSSRTPKLPVLVWLITSLAHRAFLLFVQRKDQCRLFQ